MNRTVFAFVVVVVVALVAIADPAHAQKWWVENPQLQRNVETHEPPLPDRSWHLLAQSPDGTITLVASLAREECDTKRALLLKSAASVKSAQCFQ